MLNISLLIHFLLLKIIINYSMAEFTEVELPGPRQLPYKNIYGDEYGKEWIYIPDGLGQPHLVKLNLDTLGRIDVRLQFRRYNRYQDHYIELDSMANILTGNVKKSNLFRKSIKLITHGWRSSIESESVKSIKDAYMETQDVDIITVDWSPTAYSILYHRVARSTKFVGQKIAVFLDELHKKYNVKGHQIHLIGHSLGAHVMGVAGATSKLTIGRITGLDPARPFFETSRRSLLDKLDSSDASFVDVFHTSSGFLGVKAPIGTVDFYPNGGTPPQPGCKGIQKFFEACSHAKAPQYFAQSIKSPELFPSYRCPNWKSFLKNRCDQKVFMGDSVSRYARGVFYLKTNSLKLSGPVFRHIHPSSDECVLG